MFAKAFMLAAIAALSVNLLAAVTSLDAQFRGGKTYITWTEEAGSGHTYNLYRSTSPIASVTGLTPLVNVIDNSAYDRTYNMYAVITDSGVPLTTATGVFVYTPKNTASVYYAVTIVRGGVEDKTIAAGSNSLNAAVNESYWAVPKAVLRIVGNSWSWLEYKYEMYMDYSTWPDSNTFVHMPNGYNGSGYYDHYTTYFTVYLPPASARLGLTKLPVRVYLHALNGGTFSQPSGPYEPGFLSFNVMDPCKTFYYGATKDRIVAGLKAFLADSRFADIIDSERVIMLGSSMGACGTYWISHDSPDLFSAGNPQWGYVDYPMMDNIIATPSANRPPLLEFFGTWDGSTGGIYGHRREINAYESARQGLWTKWENASHGGTTSGILDDQVPGSLLRFKRHEAFPAFTRFSLNDKFGAVDTTDFVAEGSTNRWIDWTSSLHDLGLPSDDLIDKTDSLVITLKALKPGAVADITPRRSQLFKPVSGQVFRWRNQDVATGEFVDGGLATADTAKRVTAPSFVLAQTGSRLIFTANDAAGFVKVTVLDSTSGLPLKDAQVTLSTTPVSRRITGDLGTAYILSATGTQSLNVSRSTFSSRTGISVTVLQNDTTEVTIKLLQLNVTGLVFSPDSFMLGRSFKYQPGIFTKHSDNALYPATAGVTWTTFPANIASVDGQYAVTGMNTGSVKVMASFLSFSDTLHLTVVDTAAQPDSVLLTYSSKVLDANAPFKLHATCIYKKITDHTYFYTANVDSVATWTTSNALVATVVKGVVTGHDTGSVKIVARAGTKTDTCVINIRPTPAFVKRVNFQAAQNPILETVWYKTGWVSNYANGAYSAANGYGWVSTSGLTDRSDRAGTNFLLKSYVSASAATLYRVDAPAGQYILRMAAGDNMYGGTAWIAFGSDTLLKLDMNRDTTIGGILYQYGKYNKIKDDTITVSGTNGLQLSCYGPINYLVVISNNGIAMSLVADDDGIPDDPPDTVTGTGTMADKKLAPVLTAALSAFPNPFNPLVNIAYALPARTNGQFRIYNTAGQCVYSCALSGAASGIRGKIRWDGRTNEGVTQAAGCYFARLTTSNGKTLTQKLLLLR